MRSLLHSLTLRWRLALLSAGLTFLVLCVFALIIGQVTSSRIRSDFRHEMRSAVDNILRNKLPISYKNDKATIPKSVVQSYAAPNEAVLRVLSPQGLIYASTDDAPDFTKLGLTPRQSGQVAGYRVETRSATLPLSTSLGIPVLVQYARKTGPTEASVHRLRVFLIFGVLLGSGLALALALALSRRALAPISRLTATARDIGATRDPSRRVPIPDTEDEVAELARTLDSGIVARWFL